MHMDVIESIVYIPVLDTKRIAGADNLINLELLSFKNREGCLGPGTGVAKCLSHCETVYSLQCGFIPEERTVDSPVIVYRVVRPPIIVSFWDVCTAIGLAEVRPM